ncbi:ATP-dependent RNA helicase DDX24 isoform X2 [Hetaerina americana]|uniref:ATP-dependent RNA helicase DDX24 isoform X2 n=1 Tax=Hetaerina americana TaxID=62018 RepID=UPI003A7F3698
MKKSKTAMAKKKKTLWKSIPIDATALTPGALEGLIGIEELSDYQLTTSNEFEGRMITANSAKKQMVTTNGKRKIEDATTEVQPKKKRKKKENSNSAATDYKATKTRKNTVLNVSKNTSKQPPKARGNIKTEKSEPVSNAVVEDPSSDKEISEDYDNNLRSVMSEWNDLFVPDPILKALHELGFKEPTQIQMLSLPPAIKGRKDVMGAAETGSGKTLAFGIPILAGIMNIKKFYKAPTEENEDGLENKSPGVQEQDVNFEEKEDTEKKAEMGTDGDGSGGDEESMSDEDGSNVRELESEADDEEGDDIEEPGSEEEEDIDFTIEEDNRKNENAENQLRCVKVLENVDIPGSAKRSNISQPENRLWALVLAPTRELAIQVYRHLMAAGKYTGIKMAVLVGGMAQQKQERMLRRCPEVVVATPGRLWELIKDGNAHLSTVDQIRFLAVDETDRMLEAGHFQELKDLLHRINEGASKHRRQNFVFSATLSLVHELPWRKKFKKKQTPGQKLHSLGQLIGLKDPKIVDVTPEGATATGLVETRLMSSSLLDRDIRLVSVLEYLAHSPFSSTGSLPKTIVFCNSVGGVRRLNGVLAALKLSPITLHSGMLQKQRLRSLEKFSKGGILLATDVAARGLDLPQVDHVIHFQVPHTSETYVHRSGRTARGKREGLSVLLVEPKEVPFYNRLCRTLGKDSGLPLFPLDDHLITRVKERVRIARDIDFLEHQSRRSGAEEGWLHKTAEEADIVLDEDYVSKKYITVNSNVKKDLEAKKKELNVLLRRTLFPAGFSPKYPTVKGTPEDSLFGTTKNEPVQVIKSIIQQKKQKGNRAKQRRGK